MNDKKYAFWNPDASGRQLVMLDVNPLSHDFWIQGPKVELDDLDIDPFAHDVESSITNMSEATHNILYGTFSQK